VESQREKIQDRKEKSEREKEIQRKEKRGREKNSRIDMERMILR
jgi:hypothetical protein